jgi:HK97 family phage prohead protease
MDTKRFNAVELKASPEGMFIAKISTFNKPDKYGDVTRPGCFVETITRWRASGAKVPVIFAHQADRPQMHVGDVDPHLLRETAVGLQAAGHFYLDEPEAAKVFRQLQRKALREWSFGFVIQRAKPLPSGGRELLALDLVELGPCLVGVGDTETVAVKHEGSTIDPHAAARARIELASRRVAFALGVARHR